MSDRLTQLQECFDQLATQMFASLRYINTHHAASTIPGQQFDRHFPSSSTNNSGPHAPNAPTSPYTPAAVTTPSGAATTNEAAAEVPANNNDDIDSEQPPRPDSPTTFAAALRELSRDLVMKEQQIEVIIGGLPGLGRSRVEQERRLRAVEEELRSVEGEVGEWEVVKEELLSMVEDRIARIWRP